MYTKLITYKCPLCTVEYDQNQAEHDPFVGNVCPECGEELEATGERQTSWVSIALYKRDREYGGPEEGGWYYDTGSMCKPTLRNFEKMEEAQRYYNTLVNTKGSSAYVVKVFCERIAPMNTPEQRPVYC